MTHSTTIDRFDGPHAYLSNFYDAPVTYKGVTYLNNEAAFQAQKDPSRTQEFVNIPPNKAKRLGRKVNLRPDWDHVKSDIMLELCRNKFKENPQLMQKLIRTGDADIIEGNYWHDQYWGNCTCSKHRNIKGHNVLGQILERLRKEFRKEGN